MFDLTGRGALVTGASGVIGGAIARALHARGAAVALSGTRRDALAALADELGHRAHVLPCALEDAAATAQLVRDAEAALGGLDVLVNSAGITRDNLAIRMSEQEWQSVIETNLTASFRLCRAALRGMIRRRWGRIVNVTSVVASTGNAGQANYAAAKAGLAGMAKALAHEVAARGITVNCIAPGFVVSPMTTGLSEERRQRLLQAIPAGRFGTGEDVAAGVVYLASTEAGYVTGQTLHVNGGMATV